MDQLRLALAAKASEAEGLKTQLQEKAREATELQARVDASLARARGASLAADASKEELQAAIERIQACALGNGNSNAAASSRGR